MQKLILATDGSEGANRALDFAAQLATTFDAELCLVNVAHDLGIGDEALKAFSQAEKITFGEALESHSNQILAKASSRAQQLGLRRLRTETAIGDPAQEILTIAKREGADGIIVGKRGWGTLSDMLLGSVSQKLTSLADCPVIVVP